MSTLNVLRYVSALLALCILTSVFASSLSVVHSAPTPITEYWAVICGISDYKYISDLNYCDDDVNDMYNTLVNLQGWKEDHIIKLIDSDASKLDIINAISQIDYLDDSDDVFLFFFSGHGTHGPDLSPLDETDGFDEYICPWNSLPDSYENDIRDDEFDEILDYPDSSKKVIILDTCYSGGFLKTLEMNIKAKPDVASVTLEDSFDKDLNKAGYIVLTACDDDELSAEYASLQNGVFTYYLVEGMGSGFPADSDVDGRVSGEEAFHYANPRVTTFNPDQHPQIYDGIAGEVELTIFGNADVVRVRNLQCFEMKRTMNIDLTKLRNYQCLELQRGINADLMRTRNYQCFELVRAINADVLRLRNYQYFELLRTMNADVTKLRNLQCFEMTIPPHEYAINITSLVTTDQDGNPESNFTHGDIVQFNFTIENLGNIPLMQGLVSTLVLDPSDTPFFLSYVFEDLPVGQSKEVTIGYRIPTELATGIYSVKVMIFTDWPSEGGMLLAVRESTFAIS